MLSKVNSDDLNIEAMSNLLLLYLNNGKSLMSNNGISLMSNNGKSLMSNKNPVGKVHSKFKNGLNVQFDGFLIFIGRAGTPLSSYGLNIEESKFRKIIDTIDIGNLVINKGGDKLVFYSTKDTIVIDYKNIQLVDLKVPDLQINPRDIASTQLFKYLSNIDFETLIGLDTNEQTYKFLDLLLSSDKSDFDANKEIIEFFTGRGKGLTPSGDDILLGFTLAITMFGKFESWRNALSLIVNSNKTTLISTVYHKALLQGYVSEHLIKLMKLIEEENIEIIKIMIEKVQSYGHTSGNDTLFGFYLGLKFGLSSSTASQK